MDRHVTLLNLLAGLDRGPAARELLPQWTSHDDDFRRLCAVIPEPIWAEAA